MYLKWYLFMKTFRRISRNTKLFVMFKETLAHQGIFWHSTHQQYWEWWELASSTGHLHSFWKIHQFHWLNKNDDLKKHIFIVGHNFEIFDLLKNVKFPVISNKTWFSADFNEDNDFTFSCLSFCLFWCITPTPYWLN